MTTTETHFDVTDSLTSGDTAQARPVPEPPVYGPRARAAKFALRRFEFDIGWAVLWTLAKLRLAKVLRVAPKLDIRANISVPDAETVNTLTLEEVDGRTILEILVQHSSKENRDAQIESGMEAGLQDALTLLEQVAISLAGN